MNKTPSYVGPVLAALLSLAGVAGFIVFFARDMTVYWFILSPLILIVYQFPAFVVFRTWKRKRDKSRDSKIEDVREETKDAGPEAAPDPGPGDENRRESPG